MSTVDDTDWSDSNLPEISHGISRAERITGASKVEKGRASTIRNKILTLLGAAGIAVMLPLGVSKAQEGPNTPQGNVKPDVTGTPGGSSTADTTSERAEMPIEWNYPPVTSWTVNATIKMKFRGKERNVSFKMVFTMGEGGKKTICTVTAGGQSKEIELNAEFPAWKSQENKARIAGILANNAIASATPTVKDPNAAAKHRLGDNPSISVSEPSAVIVRREVRVTEYKRDGSIQEHLRIYSLDDRNTVVLWNQQETSGVYAYIVPVQLTGRETNAQLEHILMRADSIAVGGDGLEEHTKRMKRGHDRHAITYNFESEEWTDRKLEQLSRR